MSDRKPAAIVVRLPAPPPPPKPKPKPEPEPEWYGDFASGLVEALKSGATVTVERAGQEVGQFLKTNPIGQMIDAQATHVDRSVSIATGGGKGPVRILLDTLAEKVDGALAPASKKR